jgi:NitT/TauT family transport system permease protein
VLPGPWLILSTLVSDWGVLSASLVVTLTTTLQGFALAVVGGVALAVLFNQSRLIEYSLYPYAVILQVTPIVAVAPLLLIYLPQQAAVLACAWIVAFFPVLANTTLGLNSVDHNLADLFRLYGATRWQVLRELKLPAALPYILGGLKIAGGLSLIGAVVAEIAAGSAGAGSGLAYRIAESGYRLNIPRMFAALLLLSVAGVVIFFALSLVSHLLLRRWHESAIVREV